MTAGTHVPHARDLPILMRVVAYVAVLIGYLFYCYNYVALDYVRPYLMEDRGVTIRQLAALSIAGNIGVTVGALLWAGVIARAGRKRAILAITTAIGVLAVLQAVAGYFPAVLATRALMTGVLGGYYVVATGLVVALFPPELRGKLVAVNSTMFPAANIMLGLIGGAFGDAGWYLLLWLGAVPLLVAPLMLVLIPGDRQYLAFDDQEDTGPDRLVGSWREMLSRRWVWLTVGCVVLSGIDFNAYQLFFGFVTIYLRQVREMSALPMGETVAVISSGSIVGGLIWAAISDRFGRRSALAGYVLAAAAIVVFLYGNLGVAALRVAGFVCGFGLACTSAWGAWFAEMFPPHLQPHGAALFHAGHVLAFGAPLLVAMGTERIGLTTTMAVAPAIYLLGALVWAMLPETLHRDKASSHSSVPLDEAGK